MSLQVCTEIPYIALLEDSEEAREFMRKQDERRDIAINKATIIQRKWRNTVITDEMRNEYKTKKRNQNESDSDFEDLYL